VRHIDEENGVCLLGKIWLAAGIAGQVGSQLHFSYFYTDTMTEKRIVNRSVYTMEKHQNHGFHVKSFDSRALKKGNGVCH
jgi:hypothetical protein